MKHRIFFSCIWHGTFMGLFVAPSHNVC